ncbi:hypothetical protein WEU_02651 [Citrobacter sp. KTE32]|nr:hypothetical protein WEU_02651 [Citrobacter sp. KTE32]
MIALNNKMLEDSGLRVHNALGDIDSLIMSNKCFKYGVKL